MSARARWRRPFAVTWCFVMLLAGCTSPQDAEVEASVTGSPTVELDADWDHLGTSGYVYLQVSTGDRHYELFRADLESGKVDQITDLPGPFGISNFSVSSAGLVVADASSLSDEAKWLRSDGSLVPLPGPRVLGPVINERGDVLASIVNARSEDLAILRHGEQRWTRVQRDVRGWTAPVWLGDDAIAMITIGGRRTTWSRIAADGRRGRDRLIAPGAYGPGAVTHHGQPIVMESVRRGPALLWRPGQRPRTLPTGWGNGCASPDGSRLLLWSAGRLGVLEVAELGGPVRQFGTSTTRILACGWVEERFGP